jgi:hypothetical protein
MAEPITMTSAQRVPVGLTILDAGGEKFQTKADLPEGTVITFESSNPNVVGIEELPSGLNAWLTSDDVGTSSITVRALKPDGTDMPGSPDVTEVTVQHADPDSLNVTFGAPEDEVVA